MSKLRRVLLGRTLATSEGAERKIGVLAGFPAAQLHVIHSRFRNLIRPTRRFLEEIEKEHPHRQAAVIIPELVKTSWRHYLLHNRRAAQLRRALLALGHPRMAVITLPWRRHHLHDEDHHPGAPPAATAGPVAPPLIP